MKKTKLYTEEQAKYFFECGRNYQNNAEITFNVAKEEIPTEHIELLTWDDVRKAIQMAREIKDDSAHDTFTVEDIKGCTEVCTYGWREKYTDEQIIECLRKENDSNEKD